MESINIFISNKDRDGGNTSEFSINFSKYGLNRDVKYYFLDIYETTASSMQSYPQGIILTSDITQLNTIDTSDLNTLLILPCVEILLSFILESCDEKINNLLSNLTFVLILEPIKFIV